MEEIKTLANCKPTEFLRQTNRIRKSVFAWLTATDIAGIRRRIPKYEKTGKDANAEERSETIRRNADALRKQQVENANAILEAVMEKHPDETLEVLALCCFVEPADVDTHSVAYYLKAFSQLVSDEAVIGFFTSLAQLGRTNISIS